MQVRDRILESAIQSEVIDYAVSRGWFYDKIMLTSRCGFPDLFMVREGRVVLIEVKRPGETPNKQQNRRHEQLRAHGVEVFVLDNLDDAKEILR